MKKDIFYESRNLEFFPEIKSFWKIHISSFFNNKKEILKIVSNYCNKNKLSYKYIKKIKFYKASLSKDFAPSQVGKYITIYMSNIKVFEKTVTDLYLLLKKFKATEIFGDFQYKNSIIFYRYGSFFDSFVYDLKSENNNKILDLRQTYPNNIPNLKEVPFFHKIKPIKKIL
ncbi:class III lanthionine synthetase LanKC N-terminal domain-containing protein [Mesomycoplasma neurolyticum]|uniref:RamC N-terminal domain-containing protein n=1 Tax=Mesomycoplasma neurolyticum TaxID=2120 RepID=A0A449A5K7_9BACT|nr:hypothetical protein [Mesomycoplasma neurolyticum]VEU59535.1 Uncharacterised protein [Mesomycoplasma neurolyticum]